MTKRLIGLDGEMSDSELADGAVLIQIGVAFDATERFSALLGWPDDSYFKTDRAMAVHGIDPLRHRRRRPAGRGRRTARAMVARPRRRLRETRARAGGLQRRRLRLAIRARPTYHGRASCCRAGWSISTPFASPTKAGCPTRVRYPPSRAGSGWRSATPPRSWRQSDWRRICTTPATTPPPPSSRSSSSPRWWVGELSRRRPLSAWCPPRGKPANFIDAFSTSRAGVSAWSNQRRSVALTATTPPKRSVTGREVSRVMRPCAPDLCARAGRYLLDRERSGNPTHTALPSTSFRSTDTSDTS